MNEASSLRAIGTSWWQLLPPKSSLEQQAENVPNYVACNNK